MITVSISEGGGQTVRVRETYSGALWSAWDDHVSAFVGTSAALTELALALRTLTERIEGEGVDELGEALTKFIDRHEDD